MLRKLFISLSLSMVVINLSLGIYAMDDWEVQQAIPAEECPICSEAPDVNNSLIQTSSCCNQKICRRCLGSIGTNIVYSVGDVYVEHERGFIPCPFCRADITEFAREHGIRPAAQEAQPQNFSIRQLLERGEIRIENNTLDLSNRNINDLTGLQDIPGIGSVTSIDLSQNKLTILPIGAFNSINNLKELDLYDNKLTSLSAGVFNGLANLEDLNFESNQLTSLSAGMLNGLNNLKRLNLKDNGLTSCIATSSK